MTTIINLDRDMLWPNTADQAGIGFGAEFSLGAPVVNTDGTVYERVAYMQTDLATNLAITSGLAIAAGVLMTAPQGDVTPYRVSASSLRTGTGTLAAGLYCAYGTLVTNTFTPQTNEIFLGVVDNSHVDCVVSAPPASNLDWVFGVFLQVQGSGRYASRIAVQRMIGKPPQYASSVS